MSDSTSPADDGAESAAGRSVDSSSDSGRSPEVLPADVIGGFSVQQVRLWRGQFPAPADVERYEAVLPGAFDRIISMAERQQDAAIEGARQARSFTREASRRGQWLGWSMTLAALAGAVECAVLHQPWVAGVIVALPVMGVAKSLIDSARAHAAPPRPGRTPLAGGPEDQSQL